MLPVTILSLDHFMGVSSDKKPARGFESRAGHLQQSKANRALRATRKDFNQYRAKISVPSPLRVTCMVAELMFGVVTAEMMLSRMALAMVLRVASRVLL